MSYPRPVPLQINPEFTPTTDNTGLAGGGYTHLDKVRIFDGYPQACGGNEQITLTGDSITGICRMIYNQRISNQIKTLLGTSTRLLTLIGSRIYNITPLVTSTTALGSNPITTYYATLGSNPLATVSGSRTVTVTYSAHRFKVGDTITLSGLGADLNGIPIAELNNTQIVGTVPTANSFTFSSSTAATSTGSGGGGSVVVASGIITVADTGHDMLDNDRVKILGATTTGGITAAQINKEHIIRYVDANTYDIMTAGTSTSAASGGGASVTRQEQISAGNDDASLGVGFGMGLYGTGLYGTTLTGGVYVQPRIWSAGSFGDSIIMTAGEQTGVYDWDADTATAPTLLTNAPTAVNYVFIDKEQVITLGAGGIPNRVYTSDRGNKTVWTDTFQNEVYDKTVFGAGKFISHASVQGLNLLFTNDEVYTMSYISKPLIRDIKPTNASDGLIAQNARIVVNNVAYWMGNGDIYTYNGGIISSIASDNIREYLFNNLNVTQAQKIYFAYNQLFSEIRIWYPSAGSNEIDSYLDYNVKSGLFTGAGTNVDHTAQEVPFNYSVNPRFIDSGNDLYTQDSIPPFESWSLETSWIYSGRDAFNLHGIIPDSIQDSSIQLIATVRDAPQSSESRTTTPIYITPTTEEAKYEEATKSGKCRKYRISNSNGAGGYYTGNWRAGAWQELLTGGTNKVD